MSETTPKEIPISTKVTYLSLATSVVLAALYLGTLEGRISEIKDSSTYQVMDEVKKKLFVEIGSERQKFNEQVKSYTSSEMDKFRHSINNEVNRLNQLVNAKRSEVDLIEAEIETKILEFSKQAKRKRTEIDRLNAELKVKRKRLETLRAANEVYSQQVARNELEATSKNKQTDSVVVSPTPQVSKLPVAQPSYYYIQIAATQSKATANKIARDLRRQKFTPEIIANSQGWLKVICCSRYKSEEEALSVRKLLLARFPQGRNVKQSIILSSKQHPL